MFLKNHIIQEEGLSFDDVLLIPRYSKYEPYKISLKTYLTDNIKLNTPILSSAMDTVTDFKLAIAMSKSGGLGFIHKNMSIQKQGKEIIKVKNIYNIITKKPITISNKTSIKQAIKIIKKNHINSLPVINSKNKLIGIITKKNLKYNSKNINDSIVNIMSKNVITVPEHITLNESIKILNKNRIKQIPVINNQHQILGLITLKNINDILHNKYSIDNKGRLLVGAAVGIDPDTLNRVDYLIKSQVDIILVDSAHGHSMNVLNTIKQIKYYFPKIEIIGGNVVTYEGAKQIIKAGASIIKVGIGPGSICTTRIVAGVGIPQLTAINNVYQYTKNRNIKIIADGGIRYSGDIVKALAAGASFVMIGNLLAGSKEAPGKIILRNGKKFKKYIGMGSKKAMQKGSKDRYFQNKNTKLIPEGVEGIVPYKGKLQNIIEQLSGGIKSGMGYCGVNTIEKLKQKTQFIRISNSSIKENNTYNIITDIINKNI